MAATQKPIKSCTPKKLPNAPISVSKVRVIVRVRPFLAHETSSRNGDVSCISVLDQDFESPQDEVTVYLKDPLTRSHKVSTFGFFCGWILVLAMWGSHCFCFCVFGFACLSRNECYLLDSFFGQEDNNVGQIFCGEVSPLIPGMFSGCNSTVFAYGATGSGKTYTMQVWVWSSLCCCQGFKMRSRLWWELCNVNVSYPGCSIFSFLYIFWPRYVN